jgi:exosortase/archaeosortase family protein
MELDAMGVWFLSCLVILYISKRPLGQFSGKQQKAVIFSGLLMCSLSFFSIPSGLTNPPYSIGELSLLLSGTGVIVFGLLNYRSLVFPVSIPCIAVVGYGAYELFIRNQEWITAPLIPYIMTIVTTLLAILGVKSIAYGNIISFLSVTGSPIYLAIVSDCTGIWSLGTFTVATIIVLSSFPQSINRKGIFLIGIGYFGSFCSNILRILLIALSGYYFGPTGIMEQVHIHIGWICFSAWMIIFWYYFFTRHIGISFVKEKNTGDLKK